MPSLERLCIAPVGQAETHHGFSQWKQGMNTKASLGMPATALGPTWTMRQLRGPTGTSLAVLQWTSQAWHPMHRFWSW
jgi:hypothetical protein